MRGEGYIMREGEMEGKMNEGRRIDERVEKDI